MHRKDQLFQLGQAWSQLREQTDQLITVLSSYQEKYRPAVESGGLRASHLPEFERVLRDCEGKHEDMKLMNNRFR